MRNFLVLVGTKAQLIKTAPVLCELDARSISYRLVYTGQHCETFSELESALAIRQADENLVPWQEADTVGGLAWWAVRFLCAAFARIRRKEWGGYRWGIVHGDTASTLLGALVLRLAGVPVAHLEAGLRSTKLLSPFPEEIIRRLVSRIAVLHLAPDPVAVSHLIGSKGAVIDTGGNTLRDVLRRALEMASMTSDLGGSGGYAVVSIHRHENLVNKARFDALVEEIVAASLELPIKFVLHPVTRRRLQASSWWARLEAEPAIELMPRMDYPQFISLMLGASFLMTDGGSNQEEAAMMGLPTLLLRDATERPDGLGENVLLSGLDPTVIRRFVSENKGRRWPRHAIDAMSPSARVVDALVMSGSP